jgi:hypothetical protein
MTGREKTARVDVYRLARVVGFCLLLLAVVFHGFSPSNRFITLAAAAAVFSVAAVYELSMREIEPEWLLLAVFLIWAAAGTTYYALNRYNPAGPELHGVLMAAAEPAPRVICDENRPPHKNDLVMIFGTDRVIGEGDGPFTPVRVGTCPALTIRRQTGGLVVNAFGYDSDGNVVYRVEKNEFNMVQRGFLVAHRPDKSTLEIVDDEGRESLSITYLNKNTVRIRGTFRCGDTNPVVINDDGITIGGQTTTKHSCAIVRSGTPYGIEYTDHAL